MKWRQTHGRQRSRRNGGGKRCSGGGATEPTRQLGNHEQGTEEELEAAGGKWATLIPRFAWELRGLGENESSPSSGGGEKWAERETNGQRGG